MSPNQFSSGHRKVFDIARPGKTAASATSRPIISGPQQVQDPMVALGGVGESQKLMDAKPKPATFENVASSPELAAIQAEISAPAPPEAPAAQPPQPQPPVADEVAVGNTALHAAHTDVPEVEPLNMHQDSLRTDGIIVGHHTSVVTGRLKKVVMIAIIALLLAVIVDLLLDILVVDGIPHTNFFSS